MQSKTSFFNGAVFRKTLSRYWPLWALAAAVLIFWLPVSVSNDLRWAWQGEYLSPETARAFTAYNAVVAKIPSLPVAACMLGLMFSAATFDFLFKTRATGLMASLPLRRENVFCSCFAAGTAMLLSAGLLAAVCTAIITLGAGQRNLAAVLTWFGVWSLEALTFYGIGVFCAMLTGHILVLPCLYMLLNFGGVILSELLQGMASTLLVGVPMGKTLSAFDWLRALSPCSRLLSTAGMELPSDGTQGIATFYGWAPVLVYFAVGLAFTVFALLLFRRRRMESAQDTCSIPWLRPVLKYIVTFYCALGFPAALSRFFYNLDLNSLPALLLCVALGAAIGYLVSEMIIHKSVRVLRRSWKGLVITAAVACVIVGAMKADVFGYVRRVPEPEQVASVEVIAWNSMKTTLTAPDDIATVTKLHTAAIEAAERDSRGSYGYYATDLTLTYTLQNGKTLTRAYALSGTNGPDTAVGMVEALFSRDDLHIVDSGREALYPVTPESIRYASVTWMELDGNESISVDLTAEQAADLYQNGILPDLEDGVYPRWGISESGELGFYCGIELQLDWGDQGAQYLSYELSPSAHYTLMWFQANGFDLPEVNL